MILMVEEIFDKLAALFVMCMGFGMMVLAIGFITGEWSPLFGDVSDWMRFGGGIIAIGISGIFIWFGITIYRWP